MSSEVIVRGTVRYGSPQPVVLATSQVKQGSGDSEIVTERPRRGTSVGEGTVAMSVSGRPVFVLGGTQPSHRDIGPGSRGPDVGQLESALVRLGFSPGPVDDRYDGRDRGSGGRLVRERGLGALRADRHPDRSAAHRQRRRSGGPRPPPSSPLGDPERGTGGHAGRDRTGAHRRRDGSTASTPRRSASSTQRRSRRRDAREARAAHERHRRSRVQRRATRQRAGGGGCGAQTGDAEQGGRRADRGAAQPRRGAARHLAGRARCPRGRGPGRRPTTSPWPSSISAPPTASAAATRAAGADAVAIARADRARAISSARGRRRGSCGRSGRCRRRAARRLLGRHPASGAEAPGDTSCSGS